MQTRAYAETVIRAAESSAASGEQVARWVELRMTRQLVLDGGRPATDGQTGESPAKLAAIIEEWVLRRPVGGAGVMRGQLQRLVELGPRPSIEVRVLPMGAGPHAGHAGSFIIFEMPEPYPDVAYVETLAGSLYVETPGTEAFASAYDRLKAVSLGPEDSAGMILAITEEMWWTRMAGQRPGRPVDGSAGVAGVEGIAGSGGLGGAVGAGADLQGVAWHIATRSADNGGSCVEAGLLDDGSGRVAVRHSRFPDGVVILYTKAEWEAFVGGVKDGEFDFAG